jgi:putative restriction endonuclease
MQLELVEAAHIVPVADARSIDHPRNGLALCVLHHRAFDNALITIQQDFHVVLNIGEMERLKAADKGADEVLFLDMIRKSPIHLPTEASNRPDNSMIQIANELRGWSLLSDEQVRVL